SLSSAFDGTNWYVCYSQPPFDASNNSNVMGRFVSTSGIAGTIADPDTEADDAFYPSIGFANGTYLIAWKKGSNSVFSPYVRSMTTSGTFPTPITAVDPGLSTGDVPLEISA